MIALLTVSLHQFILEVAMWMLLAIVVAVMLFYMGRDFEREGRRHREWNEWADENLTSEEKSRVIHAYYSSHGC